MNETVSESDLLAAYVAAEEAADRIYYSTLGRAERVQKDALQGAQKRCAERLDAARECFRVQTKPACEAHSIALDRANYALDDARNGLGKQYEVDSLAGKLLKDTFGAAVASALKVARQAMKPAEDDYDFAAGQAQQSLQLEVKQAKLVYASALQEALDVYEVARSERLAICNHAQLDPAQRLARLVALADASHSDINGVEVHGPLGNRYWLMRMF